MAFDPEVQELMALFDANCAAFTAKDITGYFGSIHPSAWTYQAGAFMSIDALRAMAPAILDATERFVVTHWLGGLVVDDTAAVWGEFEYATKGGDAGPVASTGSFSAHFVRVDGAWQVVFTHYSPSAD